MKYKNGVLSAIAGILQQLVTLVFGLIVPRLFIRTFGSEMNGLLSSIANLYSYLALVEAGVGTVTIQALYGPLGRDDKKSINQIMTATSQYYTRAGFYYLLGVLAIAVIYPLTVPSTIPFQTIFLLTILSGMGGVINFWVQGKYTVLFRAEGKQYLIHIVSMCAYVLSNAIKIAMLLAGYDVIAIHIGYFVLDLLKMAFFMLYIRKHYKWLNLKETPNKAALSQSRAVLIQEIMRMICSNTDILVLTYVAGDLKAVSVYSIYLMIYSTVEKLFSTFFGSFHYVLGQKYNTDKTGYMPLHRVYEALSMTGSFALYTIAFVLTTPFLRVYTAGITDIAYVDPYLPFLFTFMHLLSSGREASSRVINFAGHFRQMQWRAILESAINLLISVVLVRIIGIYGVLLGTIIAYLYRTNDIIIYASHKILERSSWITYRMWLVNMAVFGIIWYLSSLLKLSVNSFILLFAKAIPVSLAIACFYILELGVLEPKALRYLGDAVVKTKNRFAKR